MRSWALAATVLFAGGSIAAGSLIFGPGCNLACRRNFDCGEESYCGSDSRCHTDCFADVDCRNNNLGFRCVVAQGRCSGGGGIPTSPGAPPLPAIDDTWDGFNAPVNTGLTFVISRLGIPTDPTVGLDVDDMCNGTVCEDNALSVAADYVNTSLSNGVSYGESLILVEVVGLEDPPADFDLVTVKIYGGIDADSPARYINNFKRPMGEADCCKFFIDSQSVVDNQATARIRARVERGVLVPVERNDARLTLALGPSPHPQIDLKRASVYGRFGSDGIRSALLSGAVPMSNLARAAADPVFCTADKSRCATGVIDNATVLDLASALIAQPDIDIDGDGLECAYRTSGNLTIDGCCDGNGSGNDCLTSNGACTGMSIPPAVPDRPASCAEQLQIADGYSIALGFDAVPAQVLGVR